MGHIQIQIQRCRDPPIDLLGSKRRQLAATQRSSDGKHMPFGESHFSIMRGGGVGTEPVTAFKSGAFKPSNTFRNRGNASDLMRKSEPEEVKRVANEMSKKGHCLEGLSLYDKAIALSHAKAAYRNNRAAVLTALGRGSERM
ncbi:hypothetical protein V6N13_050655 [Hibiscus sabdariffa]|uniref:DUF1771 domain-containing protein n=1 Tax=Hibiscus sabdariffa TaxID=183260 RepID=A0ABR2PHZ4_9ROSI